MSSIEQLRILTYIIMAYGGIMAVFAIIGIIKEVIDTWLR